MASASASATAAPVPSAYLVMRDFTMVRNNSVLEDDLQMEEAPPPRKVHGPQWLRDAYLSISHEINHLDGVITAMQDAREDHERNSPGLCKVLHLMWFCPIKAGNHGVMLRMTVVTSLHCCNSIASTQCLCTCIAHERIGRNDHIFNIHFMEYTSHT